MENKDQPTSTFFAPLLYIKILAPAIEFYKNAFGAVEHNRWVNDDGSVHVAEMSINGALFHMHQESTWHDGLSPETLHGTSTEIGLFTDDVHGMVDKAIAAGATLLSKVTDYDYGYRQGTVKDLFGHHWQIEKKL